MELSRGRKGSLANPSRNGPTPFFQARISCEWKSDDQRPPRRSYCPQQHPMLFWIWWFLLGHPTVQLVGFGFLSSRLARKTGWVGAAPGNGSCLGNGSCHHVILSLFVYNWDSDKWCVVMSLLAISRKSGVYLIQSSDRILTTDFCFWLRYERGIKKLTRNRPWVLFFLVAAHRGHWKIQWKLNDSTNCN